MKRALALVVLVTLAGRVLVAQGDASVALGAGTVRYTGGTSFSSASISPAAEFDAPWLTASGSATIASLPQQAWSTQGRGDVWVATQPLAPKLRLGPPRFLGAWSTAAGAAVTLVRGPVTASLWGQARLSAAYGSTAAAAAAVQAFVSRFVSLEVGGGSYLRDPYQGLPRAGYLTLGVRFHARGRAARTAQRWLPLTPTARGDSLIVRFHLSGAKTVAIAGDWNAWKPKPLRSLGGDLWEGLLALRPGQYHFNLLVDGTEWVVPRGVATVSDGLGGVTGVLTVQ